MNVYDFTACCMIASLLIIVSTFLLITLTSPD